MSHTEGRVYPFGAFGYDTLIPPAEKESGGIYYYFKSEPHLS